MVGEVDLARHLAAFPAAAWCDEVKTLVFSLPRPLTLTLIGVPLLSEFQEQEQEETSQSLSKKGQEAAGEKGQAPRPWARNRKHGTSVMGGEQQQQAQSFGSFSGRTRSLRQRARRRERVAPPLRHRLVVDHPVAQQGVQPLRARRRALR